MYRIQGFMLKLGIILAALMVGMVGIGQAGDYSNLYFFGDSLTDSGTFATLFGADNRSFTTAPKIVWAEDLSASYGKSVTPVYTATLGSADVLLFPLNTDGNNFAVGSARINAEPPNDAAAVNLPSVNTQVTDFLALGTADSDALYALWAGGNDVFAQFVSGAGAPSDAAQTAMEDTAIDLTTQVTRLQLAGARNLIVIGLMDTAMAPFGLLLSESDREQLRSLKATFDTTLEAGLAGKNLLYFDTGKLTGAILDNPLAYGFTNTTDKVCDSSALICQEPANGYMYADDKHPSTLFHKVVSDWIYSSLEGARRIGLLSLVPMGRSGAQWRSIDGRLREFENFGYQGQGLFITGDYAWSRKDASEGQPSAEGSGGSSVLGYERAFSDQFFGGVTMGSGHTPFDLGSHQGTVKYDEWTLSAFTSYKFDAFYANALTTYSWLDFESKRKVALGSFNATERGDTDGSQFGVKGQLGYNFVGGSIVHGPLAGLAWERVDIDGFTENSDSVTAMTFSDQTRESLRSRLGWQIETETSWTGVNVRPYTQLTYDYEHKKDERSYRAGFVGGTSGMDVQTSNRTGGYGTLLAGIDVELSKTMHLGVGGSTTINQPEANNSAVNTTLSVRF